MNEQIRAAVAAIKAAQSLLERHDFGQKDWLIGDVSSLLDSALRELGEVVK